MAKLCPQCNETQADSLEFCPLDGALLQVVDAAVPSYPLPAPPPPGRAMRRPPPSVAVGAAVLGSEAGPIEVHRQTLMAGAALQSAVAQRLSAPAPPLASVPTAAAAPSLTPQDGGGATIGPRVFTVPHAQAVRVAPAAPPPPGAAASVAQAGVAAPGARQTARAAPPAPAAEEPPYGSTLHDLLKKGPLSVEQAIARIGLVAETVALQRKDVHGALTPWHVRFDTADATGRPKIAPPDAVRDIAQLAPYRAPELEKGEQGATDSPSAEVYALGCILFEAIAGRTPFVGTAQEQAKRHATAATPAVRMVRRDCELPPQLEMEIQRALKKRPGDRHATATALANAMRAANREDDRSTMALNVTDAAALKAMMAAAGAGSAPAVAVPAASAATRGGAAGPASTPAAGGPVARAATVSTPAAKKGSPMLVVALVAIVVLGAGLAYVLLNKAPPEVPVPVAAVVVAKAERPEVVVSPDVSLDVAPDVAPDSEQDLVVEVAAPEPDVEVAPTAPVHKGGKGGKTPKVTPESPKVEKKEEKKNPGNGPAVF